MSFKAAKCPNCAGDIQVPDDRDSVKCMYCGSDVIIREAIKLAASTINVENIFKLADQAFNDANYKESYDYYTKILEVDPLDYNAWLGKGASAAWLSTLANLRISEALSGINNAIDYAPYEKKDDIRLKASKFLSDFAVAFFNLAYTSITEYISRQNYDEFIQRVFLIESVLTMAHTFNPNNPSILSNLIIILKHSLMPYGEFTIDRNTNINVRERIIQYSNMAKALDPNYQILIPKHPDEPDDPVIDDMIRQGEQMLRSFDAPVSEHPTTRKCFIATAVYGTESAFEVILLQKFRDLYIQSTILGDLFLKFYYTISPAIAAVLRRSQLLTYVMRAILNPIVYIVKRMVTHDIR